MKQLFLFLSILFISFCSKANDISISDVSLGSQDRVNNTYQVKFDLSWKNSWHTSSNQNNWDAAWVFIKYRPSYSTEWKHAYLKSTGFVNPPEAQIVFGFRGGQSSYHNGAIIHPAADTIGNVNFQSIELKWFYGDFIADDAKIEIAVFAVEMVYIPGGPFALGDGSDVNDVVFQKGSNAAGTVPSIPFTVLSEAAITLGGASATNLACPNSNDDFNVQTRTLTSDYPKGYNAFYCMKYECSMGQYVDFLNHITPAQALARYSAATTFGHTITTLNNAYVTKTPDRACNFISFQDASAYSDWAGMGLMTELQYEKACRGDLTPVKGEYANGLRDTDELTGDTSVVNLGTSLERFSGTPPDLVFFDTYRRPLRCGINSGSNSQIQKTRLNTGASYYGIMDLSGNLAELCVGISEPSQRMYGNGNYDSDGELEPNGNGIFSPVECHARGLSMSVTPTKRIIAPVSYRFSGVSFSPGFRREYTGFRCVLTQ